MHVFFYLPVSSTLQAVEGSSRGTATGEDAAKAFVSVARSENCESEQSEELRWVRKKLSFSETSSSSDSYRPSGISSSDSVRCPITVFCCQNNLPSLANAKYSVI